MQVLKCWNPIGHHCPHLLYYYITILLYCYLYIVLFFVLQEPLRTQLPKDMMTFYLLAPSNRGTVNELGLLVYIVPANTKICFCVSFKLLKLKNKLISWSTIVSLLQCLSVLFGNRRKDKE